MGICGMTKKSPKVKVSNPIASNLTLNHNQQPSNRIIEEKSIPEFKDFEEYNSKILKIYNKQRWENDR